MGFPEGFFVREIFGCDTDRFRGYMYILHNERRMNRYGVGDNNGICERLSASPASGSCVLVFNTELNSRNFKAFGSPARDLHKRKLLRGGD